MVGLWRRAQVEVLVLEMGPGLQEEVRVAYLP